MHKLGLIAGNGRFPFLVLDAARAQGFDVVVAAIREETSPDMDAAAARPSASGAATVHWLSLGELSRLIRTFQQAGVTRAIMAGQVQHRQIFSSIRPDWRLAKVLLSLGTRNTDSLIGALAKVLEDEGIHLLSSTELLGPLLAKPGHPLPPPAYTRGAGGHRLRPRNRAHHRRPRYRADRDRRRPGVRRRRSDGRDRRRHRAGRRDHALAARAGFHSRTEPHRRKGRKAHAGHALRCARRSAPPP